MYRGKGSILTCTIVVIDEVAIDVKKLKFDTTQVKMVIWPLLIL